MPADAVRRYVAQLRDRPPDALIVAVARHFSVSLRAAALGWSNSSASPGDDYEALPPYEPKPKGGGKGRDRTQLREISTVAARRAWSATRSIAK